ncbi:MAG: RNA polymerase sigma factor [Polyangiaceae bacterium]
MSLNALAQESLRSNGPAARRHPLEAELVRLLPDLRGRALRLVHDAARADDLVQDTFERALRFADQYEQGTNLRAWAGQVLFSVFVTRYRRSRREKNALRILAHDPCAWTQPEPMRADGRLGLSVGTRTKLDALPSTFRDVVVLVDLEDCSYREAADALGVPVGTVMSRLHRGRKLLAAELAAEAPSLAAA